MATDRRASGSVAGQAAPQGESCYLVRPPPRSYLVGQPPKSLRHNDEQHGPTTHFTPRHLLRRRLLARTDPDPQLLHRSMRYDIGLPSPVI